MSKFSQYPNRKFTRIKSYSLFLSLVMCLSIALVTCQKAENPDKPPELIKFLNIEDGKSQKFLVNEIFYAPEYNLNFNQNENIAIEYNPDSMSITLSPKAGFSGLSLISFTNMGEKLTLPVIVKQKKEVTFYYRSENKNSKVYVMGNFNNWNRTSHPMYCKDSSGIFERTVFLDDGIYEYQFVVDKREIIDPLNPEKVDNGFGYYNSVLRVKTKQKENAPHIYFLPSENNTIKLSVVKSENTGNLELFTLIDNEIYPSKYSKIGNRAIEIDISPISREKGLHCLRIVATSEHQPGNVLSAWIENGVLQRSNSLRVWNDAIIYFLMIDRFNNGNLANDSPVQHPELHEKANFQGGDFAGIIQKIEDGYFDRLGINTLWISPVNETTDKAYREWPEPHRFYTGYHGYWPVSPTTTEPRFGSLSQLKTLVNVAHKHDIKVLLDFVSNHVHKEHIYYREHPEWFCNVDLPDGGKNIRRWDEYRLTTWFDTFLPSFDYINSEDALEIMTDNAIWWLNETSADGFRHDATKHIPYKFWKQLTYKIKTDINPSRNQQLLQIGECYGGYDLIKSYVNNGMLDSQFSFNQFFTARRVFVEENGNLQDLNFAIEKSLDVYGCDHIMGNIMDSHDQVRMMALFDGDLSLSDNGVERAFQSPPIKVDEKSSYDKELVFLTYLLTVPGMPIIYYGDEFGMTGANDPDNRRMMRFDEELTPVERNQLEKVSRIINLRKNHSALRRGDYLNIHTEKDVMIYSRGDMFERLIVVLNKSSESQSLIFPLPDWLNCNSLTPLLSNTILIKVADDEVNCKIPAYSSNVLLVNQKD